MVCERISVWCVRGFSVETEGGSVKQEGVSVNPSGLRFKKNARFTILMSAQQPARSLTEAAALLHTVLASAETIRTLSNATTVGQKPTVATPSRDRLGSHIFPSGQHSNITLPTAAPVRRECAPRYQAQRFSAWTPGTRRKR